ncbi:MAG: stage III sporulation AC/AD family protein [Oscillospiraceae bacterium]|nr:stage III sporulation AC/AD family protein [Oscillospiraceae bacterium]
MIALFLSTMVGKQNKDMSLLLTVATCAMVLVMSVRQLDPVIGFFEKIQSVGQLDNELLKIILKVVGIGLVGEISSVLCVDSGNAALGKTLQLLASCVILYLSLPLFNTLLELIEDILKFI